MSSSTLSVAVIESNRTNARKSTGPRTLAGKAIAAKNALRHGIFAKDLLVTGESPDELLELKAAMITRHNPRDSFELELVERVIVACWKLRRLQRFERILYSQQAENFAIQEGYEHREEHGLGHREAIPAEVAWQNGGEAFQQQLDRIENHQHRLENALHRALRQLEKAQKQQIDPPGEFADQVLSKERAQRENRQNEAEAADKLEWAVQLLDAKLIRERERCIRAEAAKRNETGEEKEPSFAEELRAFRASENWQNEAEEDDEQLG